MAAFQGINRLRLSVELMVDDHGPGSRMVVQVTAWSLQVGLLDPPPSVLLSVRCLLGPHQTLMDAIFQQLYVLDGRLADRELSGKEKTA